MITAVDTNLLLDILIPDSVFGLGSKERLRAASQEGALVIGEVVYAELAGFFPHQPNLDAFLKESGIQLSPSEPKTLWMAGDLWKKFCLKHPRHPAGSRRISADFLIGAHATLQAERLLTRDKGFYRAAFSGLRLY